MKSNLSIYQFLCLIILFFNCDCSQNNYRGNQGKLPNDNLSLEILQISDVLLNYNAAQLKVNVSNKTDSDIALLKHVRVIRCTISGPNSEECRFDLENSHKHKPIASYIASIDPSVIISPRSKLEVCLKAAINLNNATLKAGKWCIHNLTIELIVVSQENTEPINGIYTYKVLSRKLFCANNLIEFDIP